MKCTYSDCLKIMHINNFSLGYLSCKILHYADIILMLHKKETYIIYVSFQTARQFYLHFFSISN